jgi:hypothetical protein
MSIRNRILVGAFVLVCSSAWCNVFVHWTSSSVPPVAELGIDNLVLSWSENISAQVKAARKQGYQVYVEVALDQATGVAETASGLAGIILRAPATNNRLTPSSDSSFSTPMASGRKCAEVS